MREAKVVVHTLEHAWQHSRHVLASLHGTLPWTKGHESARLRDVDRFSAKTQYKHIVTYCTCALLAKSPNWASHSTSARPRLPTLCPYSNASTAASLSGLLYTSMKSYSTSRQVIKVKFGSTNMIAHAKILSGPLKPSQTFQAAQRLQLAAL